MTCIAGSVERPRTWIRFASGEPVTQEGRWCDRLQPFTNRTSCASCPAYRGIRYDGSVATGVTPSGDPVGLTPSEHEAWQLAQDAMLIEDDFSRIGAWLDRMNASMGTQALARIGEPEALAVLADRVRDWRANHPDRARELNREHARAYRQRRREAVSNDRQNRSASAIEV